ELLNNLPEAAIRNWLSVYFKGNKEAEMAFLLEFEEATKEYTAEEAENLIRQTIQSVIGKRKKGSAAENRRVYNLLKKVFEPVFEFVFQNSTRPIAFEIYTRTCMTLVSYSPSFYNSSVRYKRFIEEFTENLSFHLNQLKDKEVWEREATKYWKILLEGTFNMTFYVFDFILSIYHTANKEQKKFIAKETLKALQSETPDELYIELKLQKSLLGILVDHQLLEPVIEYFPPLRYENEYNLKLLHSLLETNPKLAEGYCYSIIQSNVHIKYNVAYYTFLEKLYTQTNNLNGLALVKSYTTSYNHFDIQDYLFIEKYLEDREHFKQIRSNLLAQLKTSFYYRKDSIILYFQILYSEKNFKKMIREIDFQVSEEIILSYADNLFDNQKEAFFSALIKRWSSLAHTLKTEEKLIRWVGEKYGNAYLSKITADSYKIRNTKDIVRLAEVLKKENL